MKSSQKSFSKLNIVRSSVDRRGCAHREFRIDEKDLSVVECQQCGQKIDSGRILLRMAREEETWRIDLRTSENITRRIAERRRTECEYCHKMTIIRQ